MIPGARIVLLGRQGAGKGTQCVRLSRHFVVPHISTGDMLRAAVREGTELGKMAKAVIDAGQLVGDDIMVGIVAERLDAEDARTRGYILDGFPRTVAQAIALDEITAKSPVDLAIDLDVPRDLVLSRLSARRVCRDCGANFQSTGTDPSPWTCENCGGDVVQRDDDTPAAIAPVAVLLGGNLFHQSRRPPWLSQKKMRSCSRARFLNLCRTQCFVWS